MCTRMHTQTLQHARQGRTLDLAQLSGLKPTMLASSVQAVVACNATVLRVCTFGALYFGIFFMLLLHAWVVSAYVFLLLFYPCVQVCYILGV